LAPVRDDVVSHGERVVRTALEFVHQDADREAAVIMLCGAVFYAALMHGRPPADDVITTSIDIVLRGLAPITP
jgi:hypothetical protein